MICECDDSGSIMTKISWGTDYYWDYYCFQCSQCEWAMRPWTQLLCSSTNEQSQFFQCDFIGDIQCLFKPMNRSYYAGQVVRHMFTAHCIKFGSLTSKRKWGSKSLCGNLFYFLPLKQYFFLWGHSLTFWPNHLSWSHHFSRLIHMNKLVWSDSALCLAL